MVVFPVSAETLNNVPVVKIVRLPSSMEHVYVALKMPHGSTECV